MVNLTVFIPWIIMAFVLDSKKLVAENLLSLIPAYGLYRGHSILETAALNETPFSAADIFVWDKELGQVLPRLPTCSFACACTRLTANARTRK